MCTCACGPEFDALVVTPLVHTQQTLCLIMPDLSVSISMDSAGLEDVSTCVCQTRCTGSCKTPKERIGQRACVRRLGLKIETLHYHSTAQSFDFDFPVVRNRAASSFIFADFIHQTTPAASAATSPPATATASVFVRVSSGDSGQQGRLLLPLHRLCKGRRRLRHRRTKLIPCIEELLQKRTERKEKKRKER